MNGSLSHLKNTLQKVALPENLQSPFNQLLELLDAVLTENQCLREENQRLREENKQLREENQQLREELSAVKQQNQQLLQRVKLLEEQLAVYRQDKFGRQSEKSSALKLSTTPDVEETVPGGMESGSPSAVSVSGDTRKRRSRGHTMDMSRLLHTDIVHDLSPRRKSVFALPA